MEDEEEDWGGRKEQGDSDDTDDADDDDDDGEDENEIRVLERVAEAGDVVSGECSTVASLEEAAGMMGGDVRNIFISQGGY